MGSGFMDPIGIKQILRRRLRCADRVAFPFRRLTPTQIWRMIYQMRRDGGAL